MNGISLAMILLIVCVVAFANEEDGVTRLLKNDSEDIVARKKIKHYHGWKLWYPLTGLLLALKVKAVLVVVAIWGGFLLTTKAFLAMLLPLLSAWKCPPKYHHHHEIEYDGIYSKSAEEPEFVGPSPYDYKQWNRRKEDLYKMKFRPTDNGVRLSPTKRPTAKNFS